jgi:hypothetical protein
MIVADQKNKKFDCVQMKWDIPQQVRKGFKGVLEAEACEIQMTSGSRPDSCASLQTFGIGKKIRRQEVSPHSRAPLIPSILPI